VRYHIESHIACAGWVCTTWLSNEIAALAPSSSSSLPSGTDVGLEPGDIIPGVAVDAVVAAAWDSLRYNHSHLLMLMDIVAGVPTLSPAASSAWNTLGHRRRAALVLDFMQKSSMFSGGLGSRNPQMSEPDRAAFALVCGGTGEQTRLVVWSVGATQGTMLGDKRNPGRAFFAYLLRVATRRLRVLLAKAVKEADTSAERCSTQHRALSDDNIVGLVLQFACSPSRIDVLKVHDAWGGDGATLGDTNAVDECYATVSLPPEHEFWRSCASERAQARQSCGHEQGPSIRIGGPARPRAQGRGTAAV
jgi:hypothetical protein